MKLLGIISMDFDITDQLLIKYSAITRHTTSVIYEFQEGLRLSQEGGIVQCSH